MQRTSKQKILMAIAFGSALVVSPFAIYRLIQHDWLVAFIDITMVVGTLLLGFYVYIKHEISHTGTILSVLALSGVCAVIYLKGPSLVYWAYPTMVGMYFILPPGRALIFNGIAVIILTPIIVISLDMAITVVILASLIVNSLFAYIFAVAMHRQRDQLAQMTLLDPLTNTGNRRALDLKLNEMIEVVNRIPQHLSLIVIDVDHFKNINDNFGHAVGDETLINLVNLINKHIRKTDSLYRLGGEEFVVLASGGEVQCAQHVAEKLRALVAKEEIIDGKAITISLGVAEYIKDESADCWLKRADEALYKAKNSGRNIACYAD